MGIFGQVNFDNPDEREEFNNKMTQWMNRRQDWTWGQKLVWALQLFGSNFLIVLGIYSSFSYTMITDAWNLKAEAEEEMKLQWLSEHGHENETEMPEFEYYEFTNWVTREYFVWMVFVSQFLSWFSGSACFTITHFKWWNLLMFFMFGICLPVDILIFYAEPFGTFGTLGTTILAFAPFLSMVADSTFPEKEMWVKGKSGKIHKVLKNSWTKHFSLSFNEKYEFVVRVTWIGWNFFGNLSLVIYLVKGDTFNEKLLGLLVFILEVFPQGLILISVLLHWHAPLPHKNSVAIEVVGTAVNVPLSIWYFTFYCDPRLTDIVVVKILMEGIHATAATYSAYLEAYVYYEEEIDQADVDKYEKTSPGFMDYDVSNIFSVMFWQLVYLFYCPFLMFKEMGANLMVSLKRDAGACLKNNSSPTKIRPVTPPKGGWD